MSLEAKLWREVSQHIELGESAPRLLKVLREYAPIFGIVVRRLRSNEDKLVTMTASHLDGAEVPTELTERRDVLPNQRRELLQWMAREEPSHSSMLTAGVRELISHGQCDYFAAPLLVSGTRECLVLFLTSPDDPVTPNLVEELVAAALSPLGVAIENDLRVHQLAQMHEALEADRSALLARLQRQDISEVVIGESSGLRNVIERIEQVAPTDVPVLILGETGSGKEVIARAIHMRSQRHHGPVVRINCGAIPGELIDSELFGHERGAFTGAVAQRKGWFERADGGTLFLDEIGELQPAAQVRLLRVLQEGTLERVGGHQTISVDVRIVAATHRRLEKMVSEGTFREDLWYRLCVFPLNLPPLRERREDIRALAEHFAKGAGKRLGLSNVELTPSDQDIALLREYSWPGNVRELATVIERAAILGRGKKLELAAALGDTLSPQLRSSSDVSTHTDRPGQEKEAQNAVFFTLDEAMAKHIVKALIQARGQIEGNRGAAELLDINPHTLRARMKKLGIDWNKFRASTPPEVEV